MLKNKAKLLSGNEAIALAARHAAIAVGVGYPGTPSTEILENFSKLGGSAEWAPNEKVAAEVALGVAFANSSALVTMKHVGLNVSQDLFFTAAYSGLQGALVAVVADDPGMASSQNEQDTRSIATCGGLPVLVPGDAQDAYDFTFLALELSHKFGLPVIIRTTTRVAHSTGIVRFADTCLEPLVPSYQKHIQTHVMVPAHAKPAHRVLRAKLDDLRKWNNESGPNKIYEGKDKKLCIIADGVAALYAREAAPEAGLFKVGLTHPLPVEKIAEFAKQYERCVVVEEGDPYITTQLRAAGIPVEERAQEWRFGELNVDRVAAQLEGRTDYRPQVIKGKPPQLCPGCPHLFSFKPLVELNCIISGDIGCYTLAAMKPVSGMDLQICMGASIGMALGMRKVLSEADARRVVSVIGDSTFMHSGLTGLVEMVYNTPATGHVVIVLDNRITAMTGHQENPSTGKKLDGSPATEVNIESVARGIGVQNVKVFNPIKDAAEYKAYLAEKLAASETTVIILKQPCVLIAGKIAKGK